MWGARAGGGQAQAQAQALTLAIVAGVADRLGPVAIVQVPPDRAAQTGLQGFARLPIQLVRHLAGVDGVTAVVALAVLREGDALLSWPAILVRRKLVQFGAERTNQLQIGRLVAAADIVLVACAASLEYEL